MWFTSQNSKLLEIEDKIPKTTGSTGDVIGNRIADKIIKSPKLHHRRFQKQLQMKPKRLRIKKKDLKKDIYIYSEKRQNDDLR